MKDTIKRIIKQSLVMDKIARFMCETLTICGTKVSYEEALKEMQADFEKDWPLLKDKIIEEWKKGKVFLG